MLELKKLPYKFKIAAAIFAGLVSNKVGCWQLYWSHSHSVKYFLERGEVIVRNGDGLPCLRTILGDSKSSLKLMEKPSLSLFSVMKMDFSVRTLVIMSRWSWNFLKARKRFSICGWCCPHCCFLFGWKLVVVSNHLFELKSFAWAPVRWLVVLVEHPHRVN